VKTPHKVATSHVASASDLRKRDLAWEVLRTSNEPVVGFAKLMVPTALSSVGAIVALAQAAGRLTAPDMPHWLVLGACILCLLATLLFAVVVYARPVRVSADDYDNVLDELLEAAHARRRLTSTALAVHALGVLLAVSALIK
jgi:hypothetical protein